MQPTRMLLGPQRPASNLGEAVHRAALPDGPIAVIAAGWQEGEADIDDVQALIGRPVVNVRLYARAEELFHAHTDLHDAYRARQKELVEQQGLYRLRLRHLAVAARQVMRSDADQTVVAAEQRHAISQLRALDRHHSQSVQAIHARFSDRFGADQYAPVADVRAEIARDIEGCQALIITGGNCIVLLNRLLLFDIAPLLTRKHVIAWSAGAMVLCNQIVLFHDYLPEGRRDSEVLGPGLGLIRNYVLLPDAKHRIRDNDKFRLILFGRRFSPATSALLDEGSLLQFAGNALIATESIRRIKTGGSIGVLKAK